MAYVVTPLADDATVNVAAPSLACTEEMVGAPGSVETVGAGVLAVPWELPPPPPPQLDRNSSTLSKEIAFTKYARVALIDS